MLVAVNPGPIPIAREVPREHLAAALRQTDVTLSELARRLSCAFSTVSRWMNGHAAIGRGRWLEILEALGLPADWQPSDSKPEPNSAGPQHDS